MPHSHRSEIRLSLIQRDVDSAVCFFVTHFIFLPLNYPHFLRRSFPICRKTRQIHYRRKACRRRGDNDSGKRALQRIEILRRRGHRVNDVYRCVSRRSLHKRAQCTAKARFQCFFLLQKITPFCPCFCFQEEIFLFREMQACLQSVRCVHPDSR